jgi:hypothetical protein
MDIPLITFRLIFGGTPCSFKWGVISKSTLNLVTSIHVNNTRDPRKHSKLQTQDEFPLPPRFLPDDTPFWEGKELMVGVEINNTGIHNIYIDDLIGLGINLLNTNNQKQLEQAPLLAMDICTCCQDPNKPIS